MIPAVTKPLVGPQVSFPLGGGRVLGLLLLAATALAACGRGGRGAAPQRNARTVDGAEYLAHEVIVRRASGTSVKDFQAAIQALGGTVLSQGTSMSSMLNWERVILPQSVGADDAIVKLMAKGVVEKAERNYVITRFETPTDPMYSQLWGMQKVGAPTAWNLSKGSAEIIVAVTDTGVDYKHPELAANMWKNPGEIPGNGIDDDKNGFVDDVYGYDFSNKDGDPFDDHGHGTHVSGTIGAVANNGQGVAGVNWTVRIQAVKCLSASGSGNSWDGAQAVLYAARSGARVINASWGCPGSSCYASYMVDAIRTFASAGGLFVAAAGNAGSDNDAVPTYPGGYGEPNVVAVAATDSNDLLASFSNYGATKVHLGAPGVGILSTQPGNKYVSWNGTSMATPHVAGAAALYLSVHPDAGFATLKEKLLGATDKVGALAGKTLSGGRLNVGRLLTLDGDAPAAPKGLQAIPGASGDVRVSWLPNTEPDLAGYRLRWWYGTGPVIVDKELAKDATSTLLTGLQDGVTYKFVIFARDAAGNLSAPSDEVTAAPRDFTAPPAVIDLVATTIDGALASGKVTSASGELLGEWRAEHAADGTAATAWITPGRIKPQEEYVIVGLDTAAFIEKVAVTPSVVYPNFFPVDYDIEVSSDGVSWQAVGGERNVSVSNNDPRVVAFPGVWARAVRLRVLRSHQHESGIYYAGLAEIEVRQVPSVSGGIRLRFAAPGDDPGMGRAASYDIRMLTSAITATNFGMATPVPAPPPLAAGLIETVLVKDLRSETKYYFALTAKDAAGNVSALSNVATASTTVMPPSTITDLRQAAGSPSAIALAWTAPGSDGKAGQAARYEMRHSTDPLTPANFSAASPVPGLPEPQASGAAETFSITGLKNKTLYYFAVRAIDQTGTVGGISNVAVVLVQKGTDNTPPAAVDNLLAVVAQDDVLASARIDSASDQGSSATPPSQIVDGRVDTYWLSKAGAPTDPAWIIFDLGQVAPITQVRIHPATYVLEENPQDFELQASTDKINWTPFVQVTGWAPATPTWNEWGTLPMPARFVRLFITKRGRGAWSQVAGIGEVESRVLAAQFGANLVWVAPGDDDWRGSAARYDLRTSPEPISDKNFAAALPIETMVPLPGGQLELLRLPALPFETTHHFAIKTVDQAGNWSDLSNVATLETPAVPPAAVADLTVVGADFSSITLKWTASGDDGLVGRASAYELRYSRQPINAAGWLTAVSVPTPVPAPAGAAETFKVPGLNPNTVYYFALKVVDDRGATSLMSNVVRGETADGLAPNRVVDLVAAPVDPASFPPVVAKVVESSGTFSPETDAKNLLDGDDKTAWVSPTRASVTTESVRLDLGGARRLGHVRLRAASGYQDLFPVDFTIEVLPAPGGAWLTVVKESSFVTKGDWEDWQLGAVAAVEARLTVTRSTAWGGGFHTAVGDLEVYEDGSDGTRVRLSWTAPGDDGDVGTAARYDVRRASTTIDAAGFARATSVTGAPVPRPAGSFERLEVTALSPETQYCFALTATDDVALTSDVSNSPCVKTPGLPPGTVVDLHVTKTTAKSATLAWTAPGSDGSKGQAQSYEMRLSNTRITSSNWNAATPVTGLGRPQPAGAAESFDVPGLTGLTTYYFAIRAVDEGANWSGLSNNALGRTADDVLPGRVTDLAAVTDKTVAGAVIATWTAPGDNGPLGQAARYDLRISNQPISDANFVNATPVPASSPKSGGGAESVQVANLQPEAAYYLALKTTDAAGNVSALSNVAQGRTRDEPPAAVTDLGVISGRGMQPGNGQLVVRWTAPGDDGVVGTAARYDLRVSTALITSATFAQATSVAGLPAPAPSGTAQLFTVAGLTLGKTYYLAIVSYDDRNNASPLSNVASGPVPDEVPPAAVIDLTAKTGTGTGQLDLAFTAPGDDGVVGIATAYELKWSLAPLDASNFATANSLAAPVPVAGGTKQTLTASGMPDEAQVYVALRARDDSGNWSALSNVAVARTLDVAPAAITSLRQTARTTTSVTVTWTAPGDDAHNGTASAYQVRVSKSPLDGVNFETALLVPSSAPQAAGKTETLVIPGLDHSAIYYVAVRTSDDRGNRSALSNVLQADTTDDTAPGAIADLAALTGPAPGTVVLSWTATGDDGNQGTAKSYELRRSKAAVNAASWAAATPVTGVTLPKAAGTRETFTVTGLDGETTFHFALRAVDDGGNAGSISNDAAAATPPVPPGAVTDLAGTTKPGAAILTWTAPGDDGNVGQAVAYDIRYSKTPIASSGFLTAMPVPGAPRPALAGGRETVTVSGLDESTVYYFALKTKDDLDVWSGISNMPKLTTPDVTAPSAPASLAVATPDLRDGELAAKSADASSWLGASWNPPLAIDQNEATAWASQGSQTGVIETLTIDLGGNSTIDRIKLLPDGVHPQQFPRAFSLDVSPDKTNWTTVAVEEEFTTSAAAWMTWGFPAIAGRWVRLTASETNVSFGRHYAIVADVAVWSAAPTQGSAQLTWVAPGDDGMVGTAKSYEIYRHTSAFDVGGLGAAVKVVGPPAPLPAGALQSVQVTGLAGETTYYWAVRAIDESGNVGALSALATAKTNQVAPAPVQDMAAVAQGMTAAKLTWTAPGDDGNTGRATSYELRQATHTLTSQNFPLCVVVPGVPTPTDAGTKQSLTVSGLAPGTVYRFAVIARDEAGNSSYLSNVAVVATDPAPDVLPPAAVTDLVLRMPLPGGVAMAAELKAFSSEQKPDFVAAALVDGNTGTAWASAGRDTNQDEYVRLDLGALLPTDGVRVYPAPSQVALFPPAFEIRTSPDGLAWTTVASRSGIAAPGMPIDVGFALAEVRYVELRATQLARLAGGLYYAVVAELEILTPREAADTVYASFTAPADNGPSGRAARYDLRLGLCPYAPAAATPIVTSLPAPAGTPERFTAVGAGSGRRCAAVVSTDSAGNTSALSNVAEVVVP